MLTWLVLVTNNDLVFFVFFCFNKWDYPNFFEYVTILSDVCSLHFLLLLKFEKQIVRLYIVSLVAGLPRRFHPLLDIQKTFTLNYAHLLSPRFYEAETVYSLTTTFSKYNTSKPTLTKFIVGKQLLVVQIKSGLLITP